MLQHFLIGREERGMEDGVNLPLGGDLEMEGHLGNDFLNFKWACLFHLELFGTIHVEVGHLKPDLVSYFPQDKLRGYLFLHLLLGNLVGGLGIISGSRQI